MKRDTVKKNLKAGISFIGNSMFIINTPDGSIDIDDPKVQQENHNRMMDKVLKENEMQQSSLKEWFKLCQETTIKITSHLL